MERVHETRNGDNPRTRAGLAEAREEEGDEEVCAEVVPPNLRFEALCAPPQVERLWDHYVLYEDLFGGRGRGIRERGEESERKADVDWELLRVDLRRSSADGVE